MASPSSKNQWNSRARITAAPPARHGKKVSIETPDGTRLAGTLFTPSHSPDATILMCSGTGIPRGFYHGFARFLARRGFAVLTFDFRGVAESAPDDLRGYQATKQDWARLDTSAALSWLAQRFPGLPSVVAGHSVGTQMLGLVDRPEDIDAVVSIASGFGYWGAMPRPYRYFVWSLWYLAIPFFARTLGYIPAKRLGLGEDLPAGVGREWARWGKRRAYFTSELAHQPGFARLQAPWLAVLATDDEIATRENSLPLYDLYPNSPLDLLELDPADHGMDEIGHLGFFSRRRRALWPQISSWLQQTLELPTRH